jgi:hypothetical protein
VVEQPLPPDVAAVLVRAHDLERIETGHGRIAAYRLTRALLGGAREAGFSASVLAECLGVSVSTLQGRAYSDGWIREPEFAALSGIDIDAIRRWRRSGRLPRRVKDDTGCTCYRASDLITTMLNPPGRRNPHA